MEGSNASDILSLPPSVDKKIVYAVQISGILLIILFCLINLTVPNLVSGDNEKLWIGLLGSSIGYLLPNPTLKNQLKFL